MSKLSVLFFWFLLSATAHSAEKVFPKVPLVFIHGFKGAGLKNESGAVWLTPWQALGLSTPQLALPLRWNGDVQQPDEITADEVLSRVRVVPFLFGEDIYGPWLEAAAEFNRPFYTFAYDWRRDNLETLEKFEKFIEDVCTRDGVAKVQVVAHSMGGLVAMALLNKRPEIFHDVIFVGVPFTGGVGFLEDLHAGVLTGLNSRILSPPVLFTFPSVYALFPLDGVGLEDRQGKPVKMDFYSAAAWRRNGLAVFWKPSADANAQEKFLQKALEHAKKFRLLLQPHAAKYPTVTVVLGKTLPTIVAARRTDVESKRGWDLDASTRQPGDGRVAAQHAVPPKGIEYRTFDSKAGHANLLSDPEVIGLIRDSVK